MTWQTIIFAAILVFTNICWLLVFLKANANALETYKLIASKTISEYSWLKKVEGQKLRPEQPSAGYQSVWEETDG